MKKAAYILGLVGGISGMLVSLLLMVNDEANSDGNIIFWLSCMGVSLFSMIMAIKLRNDNKLEYFEIKRGTRWMIIGGVVIGGFALIALGVTEELLAFLCSVWFISAISLIISAFLYRAVKKADMNMQVKE